MLFLEAWRAFFRRTPKILDSADTLWELPIMNATVLDDRRRLVMPPGLKPHSAVIVEQLDADTWIVKRAKSVKARTVVLLPDVNELSQDPEWEKVEDRITQHTNKNVTPFEE